MPLDVAQIRRLVQARLADVKRMAVTRRDTVAAAELAYATFLAQVAVPAFTTVAQILSSENHPYRVITPGDTVRLVSERSARTYIDLRLESSGPAPVVMAEVSRERGSRVLTDERPVAEGVEIAALSDEELVEFLIEALGDLIS